jgi:hypothetical protein
VLALATVRPAEKKLGSEHAVEDDSQTKPPWVLAMLNSIDHPGTD